jgi:hypothetical protein
MHHFSTHILSKKIILNFRNHSTSSRGDNNPLTVGALRSLSSHAIMTKKFVSVSFLAEFVKIIVQNAPKVTRKIFLITCMHQNINISF